MNDQVEDCAVVTDKPPSAVDDQIAVDFAVDAEYPPPREDGRPGPPDGWERASWLNYKTGEFWCRGTDNNWRVDPPPVRPLGHQAGEYYFVTEVGELRSWTSSALHGRGGLADLFGGDLRWARRHFPGFDRQGNPSPIPHAALCMGVLIRICVLKGIIDGSLQIRSVGTWRGPDNSPLVHAGNKIFLGDECHRPGAPLGDVLYTVASKRQAPAHQFQGGKFTWRPATAAQGLGVVSDLDSWNWESEEARELYAGGLFSGMLGDFPSWKSHLFLRAPPACGKSSLLRYTQALLGAAAGPVLKTYSKAYIESRYSGMGLAVLLDEAESDTDANRIKNLFELVRMLSDDGAMGGRGSSSGKAREFNVHGPVFMAATVRDRWRPQDRRRITLLELLPLLDRNQPSETQDTVKRLIDKATVQSPSLRARAIDKWNLYLKNLKTAHASIMNLGGISGDGDQLGGLIAGWWTLTSDAEPDDDRIADVKRFLPFIRTMTEIDDGDDEPNDCFSYLLGAPLHHVWRAGEILTVGQTIARARDDDYGDAKASRQALLAKGMRLIQPAVSDTWKNAWLAIANKHNGLDEIFSKVPEWGGEKWNQVMRGLPGADVRHPSDPGNPPLRFAGPLRRALFIPPILLPLMEDEQP